MSTTTETGSSNSPSTATRGPFRGLGWTKPTSIALGWRGATTKTSTSAAGSHLEKSCPTSTPYTPGVGWWMNLGDEDNPEQGPEHSSSDGRINLAVSRHRLTRLDWWESELDLVYAGEPTHPVTVAIQHHRCKIRDSERTIPPADSCQPARSGNRQIRLPSTTSSTIAPIRRTRSGISSFTCLVIPTLNASDSPTIPAPPCN